MGTFIGSTIRFKRRKDYTNTLELDIIITKNIKRRGNNNPNNFNNNKDYKKIKISKLNKYYNK